MHKPPFYTHSCRVFLSGIQLIHFMRKEEVLEEGNDLDFTWIGKHITDIIGCSALNKRCRAIEKDGCRKNGEQLKAVEANHSVPQQQGLLRL